MCDDHTSRFGEVEPRDMGSDSDRQDSSKPEAFQYSLLSIADEAYGRDCNDEISDR